MATNPSVYIELGGLVSSLTLDGVSEFDAAQILSHFKRIQSLTLKDMIILKGANCYALRLHTLKLVDCKIERAFLEKWFKVLSKTLLNFDVTRSYFKVSLEARGSICSQLHLLPNVVNARLVDPDKKLKFRSETSNLKHFEIVCRDCDFHRSEAPNVECLIHDIRDQKCDRTVRELQCNDSLRSLTMRRYPSPPLFQHQRDFDLPHCKNLQSLTIRESVDITKKQKLESFNVALDVHYIEPSQEPNLMLKLNDDCLILIFSYLKDIFWMKQLKTLAATHPRFNDIVCQYFYPKDEISLSDHLGKQRLSEDFVKAIGPFCSDLGLGHKYDTALIPFFPNLKKVHLHYNDSTDLNEAFDKIPSGLLHLEIGSDSCDTVGLRSLLRRLDGTLQSLEVNSRELDMACLEELHNLRECTFNTFNWDLKSFLSQNKETLEKLTLDSFYQGDDDEFDDDYDDEEDYEDDSYKIDVGQLVPLPKLKALLLKGSTMGLQLNSQDYPALEELFLSVDEESCVRKSACRFMNKVVGDLVQLKRLHLEADFYYFDFSLLHKLKNLERLVICQKGFSEKELFELFRHLKKLTHFGSLYVKSFSFKLDIKLRKLAIDEQRMITLHSSIHSENKWVYTPWE